MHDTKSLDTLMRTGPLPRSAWVHRTTRESVMVLTLALSTGGFGVNVVFSRLDGVTFVCGVEEFAAKYERAKGV